MTTLVLKTWKMELMIQQEENVYAMTGYVVLQLALDCEGVSWAANQLEWYPRVLLQRLMTYEWNDPTHLSRF